MYDLVRFNFNNNLSFDFGSFDFKKLYFFDHVQNKVKRVNDITEAVKVKKQKTLVLLNEYKFDKEAVREIAGEQKICFLITVGELIKLHGFRRAILLSKLKSFLKLCNKFGAYYALVSFSENDQMLRSSQELINIGYILGLNAGQSKFALERIKNYLE